MMAPARLNDEQAREYLGCTREQLKRLRQTRKVRFYRLGHRSVSYERESLDRFLTERRVEALL